MVVMHLGKNLSESSQDKGGRGALRCHILEAVAQESGDDHDRDGDDHDGHDDHGNDDDHDDDIMIISDLSFGLALSNAWLSEGFSSLSIDRRRFSNVFDVPPSSGLCLLHNLNVNFMITAMANTQ